MKNNQDNLIKTLKVDSFSHTFENDTHADDHAFEAKLHSTI